MANGFIDTPESREYANALEREVAALEAQKKALIEEFRKNVPVDWSADDIKEKLRTSLLPTAWHRIEYLLANAESESVQASLAKYVVSIAIGQIKITDDNDPGRDELNNLLSELMDKNPSDVASEQ